MEKWHLGINDDRVTFIKVVNIYLFIVIMLGHRHCKTMDDSILLNSSFEQFQTKQRKFLLIKMVNVLKNF